VRVAHDDVQNLSKTVVAEGTVLVETATQSRTVLGPADFVNAIELTAHSTGDVEERLVPFLREEWALRPDALVLEMSVRGHVPVDADAMPGERVSWSFAVDLDGNPATGLPGRRPPVLILPDLGVELFVEFGFEVGTGFFKRALAFDPTGRPSELPSELLDVLFPETRLDSAGSHPARNTIRMRVPLNDLEDAIVGLGGAIKLQSMRFAAVASYSNKLGDDPVVDVFPDALFVPTGRGELKRRR
jgi:hypothetical protein